MSSTTTTVVTSSNSPAAKPANPVRVLYGTVVNSTRLGETTLMRRTDFPNGDSIVEFRVVTGAKDSAAFYTVVTRGNALKDALANVKRGARLLIVGQTEERTYTNKQGQSATELRIHARHIGLAFNRAQDDASSPTGSTQPVEDNSNALVGASSASDMPF